MAKKPPPAPPPRPSQTIDKPSDFERVFARFGGRNWNVIKEFWTPYLPTSTRLGAFNCQTASSVCSGASFVSQIPTTGEHREPSVSNLRESTFEEGLHSLTKAIYLIRSMTIQTSAGYPSWSYVSAYHSALFACQAILRFLGVNMLEVQNKWLVTDIWPGPSKGNVKQNQYKHKRNSEIQFVRCKKVDQRHWWQLFRAIVDETEITIWDAAIVDALTDLAEVNFAYQRNKLIYQIDHWPIDDLPEQLRITLLPEQFPKSIGPADFVYTKRDFTMVVAITLIKLAREMLTDIARGTPSFSTVTDQYDELMKESDSEVVSRLIR